MNGVQCGHNQKESTSETILILTVGLMLAGCGSPETTFEIMVVRQRPGSDTPCIIAAHMMI